MKKIYYLFLFAGLFSCKLLWSQNQVNLQLNHKYDGQPLTYGTNYSDEQNRAIKFSRLRYYMSSLKIEHDGGQQTTLTDLYILANGNTSSYELGSYNIDVVEKLIFDVGVDYTANHGNTSDYPSGNPLGPQAPLMDWGWPSGYLFFDLNGRIDNSDDGVANKTFEFRGFGDLLLTNVEVDVSTQAVSGELRINVDVLLDRWIQSLDLVAIGINHGSVQAHGSFMHNGANNQVFVASGEASTASAELEKPSYIHIDYAMAYAPVLNYSLAPNQYYNLSVYDLSGRLVFQDNGLDYEGSYFILKELNSGTYLASFTGDNYSLSKTFVVNR